VDRRQRTPPSQQPSALANRLTDGDVSRLADNINNFFHSISADLPVFDHNCVAQLLYDIDDFPVDLVIEPCSVEYKLANINVCKSPGPDQTQNWFLRDFSVYLAEPVCCIFNTSLRTGIFPQLWKQANVIPIPKVQPPGSIESDLWAISLTSTSSKILESYIGNWIMNCILPTFDIKQFGAIRGRSTTHALVDMLHIWHKALDQSRLARVMFVDFSKAFDRVDHTAVINNLTELAIPGLVVTGNQKLNLYKHINSY